MQLLPMASSPDALISARYAECGMRNAGGGGAETIQYPFPGFEDHVGPPSMGLLGNPRAPALQDFFVAFSEHHPTAAKVSPPRGRGMLHFGARPESCSDF